MGTQILTKWFFYLDARVCEQWNWMLTKIKVYSDAFVTLASLVRIWTVGNRHGGQNCVCLGCHCHSPGRLIDLRPWLWGELQDKDPTIRQTHQHTRFFKKNSHILFCLSQCNGNSADVWKILAFPALSLVRKSTLNACGDRLVVFMVSKPVFSAELHQLFKLGA